MTEFYLAPTPATRQGPLSLEQLHAAHEAGLFAAETPCLIKGEAAWRTVQDVLQQYPLPEPEPVAEPEAVPELPPVDELPPAPELPPVDELPPAPELPPVDELPPAPELPPVDELPPAPALPPVDELPPAPELPPVDELPPAPELPPVDELPPAPALPPVDELPPAPSFLPPAPAGKGVSKGAKIGIGAAAAVVLLGVGGFCLMPSASEDGEDAASVSQKVTARISVPKPRLSIQTDEEARRRLMSNSKRIFKKQQVMSQLASVKQPTIEQLRSEIQRAGKREMLAMGAVAGDLEVCAYAVEKGHQAIDFSVLSVGGVAGIDDEIALYLLSKMEAVDEMTMAVASLFYSRQVLLYALSRADWGIDSRLTMAAACKLEGNLSGVEDSPQLSQMWQKRWPVAKGNIEYLLTQCRAGENSEKEEELFTAKDAALGPMGRHFADAREKGTLPRCTAPLPPEPQQTSPVTTDEEFIAAITEMMKYQTRVNPEGTHSFRMQYPTVAAFREELTRLLRLNDNRRLVDMTAGSGSAPCMMYLVEKKGVEIRTNLICSALRAHNDALACALIDKGDFLSEEKEEYGKRCRPTLLDYMVKCGCAASLRHAVEKGVPVDAAQALCTLLQRHSAYLKEDAKEYRTTWQILLKHHMELADYLVELAKTQQSNAPLKAALDYAAPNNEFAQHLRELLK